MLQILVPNPLRELGAWTPWQLSRSILLIFGTIYHARHVTSEPSLRVFCSRLKTYPFSPSFPDTLCMAPVRAVIRVIIGQFNRCCYLLAYPVGGLPPPRPMVSAPFWKFLHHVISKRMWIPSIAESYVPLRIQCSEIFQSVCFFYKHEK